MLAKPVRQSVNDVIILLNRHLGVYEGMSNFVHTLSPLADSYHAQV